jgi:hypothetical protein
VEVGVAVELSVDEESDDGAEVGRASGADARGDRRAMPHDVRHIHPNPLSSADSCGQSGSCGQLGHSPG